MAYGAEILNQSGDTVFSTEDPVFEIIGKGTVTLNYQFSSSVTHEIWSDPTYGSYSTLSGVNGYMNTNAIGTWDEDVLTLYEVLSGQRIYKWGTESSSTRYQYLFSFGQTSVRYVQVRPATNITAPTSGYGMVFYDSSGNPTWSADKKVLDNVQPLSVTTTTNRWYYWNNGTAITSGSTFGLQRYRGIRGTSTGFVKEATNFSNYGVASPAYRDLRLYGSFDRATYGFSANIDWNQI